MLNNRLNVFPYSDNDSKQDNQIFEKMEKYDDRKISRKKKVSTILEEL